HDLRADVQLVDALVESGHEGDRGDLLDQRPIARFGLAQLRFAQLALGDVANGAGDQHARLRRERTEADLDGELAAVLVYAEQWQPAAHGARVRRLEKL